jgi:hypothetical protein
MHGVSLRASRDFAEELTALRAIVAWREGAKQEEVRAWVWSGQLPHVLVDRELAFRLVAVPGV